MRFQECPNISLTQIKANIEITRKMNVVDNKLVWVSDIFLSLLHLERTLWSDKN